MGHVRSIKPGLLRFSVPPPPLFFYANVKIGLCSEHFRQIFKNASSSCRYYVGLYSSINQSMYAYIWTSHCALTPLTVLLVPGENPPSSRRLKSPSKWRTKNYNHPQILQCGDKRQKHPQNLTPPLGTFL